MKKNLLLKSLFIIVISIFTTNKTIAQFVQMDATTNGTVVNTCSSVFQTSGGSGGGSYSNSENYLVTICPDVPGDAISIDMITFALDPTNTAAGGPCGGNADEMCFWDGPDMSAASLGCYNCTALAGVLIQCTTFNPSGCLTVRFKSNSTGLGSFSGSISCTTPCDRPTAVLTTPTPGVVQKICVGESITFNGSASYPAPTFSITKYIWNFGDGTIDSTSGSIVSHTFTTIGEHLVDLFIRDNNNCAASNFVTVPVWVSTTPTFTNITDNISFCQGSGAGLTGGVGSSPVLIGVASPTTYVGNGLGISGDTLYVPDDVGSCFESEINVNIFTPGAVIGSISDFETVLVDMEHSYMGDIVISLTCPNGSSVILHNQGGSCTHPGLPIDLGGATDPVGIPYSYGWSPTSTIGTWVDYAATAPTSCDTLPPGIYESVNSFDSLIGCPLNGTWSLQICDFLGADDGWVTSWGLEFAPYLYPDITEYTPVLLDGAWSGANPISASMITSNADSILTLTTSITPGIYNFTYTVSDDFGCSYDTTIQVSVIGNPIADAGPDQLSCVGALIQLDGTATGGLGAPTGACVYQINMQDTFGDGWNGFTLNVTSGGVTTPITLAGGVSSSATFTVAVGANFSISSTGGTANSQISYSLINDLGVAIYNEGTGVTTGFEYNGIGSCDNFNIQWTPIPTISNANILDPTFTVGANSTMILTVQEGLCQDADTMTIIADPSGTIEIIRLDTLVCGTYPASAVPVQMYLNTTTAPGTTYAWTGPVASTISNSSIENPIVSPSATTTYSLTIGLPAGCTYSDEMKITFRNPPITSVSQTDTICKGQQAPLIVSGGAYWEWLNDDDLSCNSCTNPVATPEYSTTYYLNTYSEYWCRTRDSILVIVYPNVILDVTPKYSEVYKGETVTFDSEGFYSTINWDKELYLSDSSVANPICTPNSSITYIIEAQDALGICKETDTVFVNYLGCQGFKMPTAFSPNGDNSNDVLYVLQSGFESFDELSIYNRWGELIFNTENIGNGWNGTYKGVPQEIGTYVYNIKGTCEGNKIDVKGNISLLR